jgi:hypothetical protein
VTGRLLGLLLRASQMGRFETKWLSRPENLTSLADLPGQWIDKMHRRRLPGPTTAERDKSLFGEFGSDVLRFGGRSRRAKKPSHRV